MPCFKPLNAWKSPLYQGGKSQILFTDPHDSNFLPIQLPCGRCIGCRIQRSKEWALRCIHEASFYDANSFITLTYKEDPYTLNVRDFQLFMKRLRKKVGKVRFFHCGEYGSLNFRPHHHALIFGWRPPDLEIFGKSVSGYVYRSDLLESLWTFGFSTVGDVTFDSAAYVARYILKKQTGPSADDHYQGRKPEYITMSRNPGIGQNWFKAYSGDVFPKDFIHYEGGKIARPPRYYEKLFELNHAADLKQIKERRLAFILKNPDEVSPARLYQKEEVLNAKLNLNERKL